MKAASPASASSVAADAAERDGERQAGGEHAAEHDRHHHQRDRQRDRLGPLGVLLGQLGHLLVEQLLAADQHPRCVDGPQPPGDVVDQVLVGVVAEVGREDDRTAVAPPSSLGRVFTASTPAGRPQAGRARPRRRRRRRRRPRPRRRSGASSVEAGVRPAPTRTTAPRRGRRRAMENSAPAATRPRTRTTSHPAATRRGARRAREESRGNMPRSCARASAPSSGRGWISRVAPGRTRPAHEPRLVGVDDRLHPVAQAELHEHPPDVGLHRGLAHDQLGADLGVVAAPADQLEHLLLARSGGRGPLRLPPRRATARPAGGRSPRSAGG